MPRWPMLIFRTPKGWTGPKFVDGKKVEGSFRAHQVPISMERADHLNLLEEWLRSYHPEELFDENGTLKAEIRELCPTGNRRMGSNPIANGGLLLKDLKMPNFMDYGIKVDHGMTKAQDMLVLSSFVRDIFKENPDNFRIFGPDETMSNRLYDVFDATKRTWEMEIKENDENLAPNGRVMDSMLSEHMCEGMLEGYLLTGRHGFFASYEAFIRIIDSMAAQHAKWLKVCNEIPWRASISSLNLILTSNVWQQDHNGFTHQDPGFLDHIANKKVDVVRMYLPPDANCLLSCVDHVLKSKNYVNVIVASKHPSYQWLTIEEAREHCTKGIGTWSFIADDQNPELIMACAGDTPTLETIAAVKILKSYLPKLRIRFINVVDLMKIDSTTKHPHAMSDGAYDSLFTFDKPIIFAFHGYPTLIHELTYYRHNRNIHVHGYQEEGTITTPFDMRVKNKIDRFHLVIDAVDNLNLGDIGVSIKNDMEAKLKKHQEYIVYNGIDMDEIRNWSFKD